MTWINEILQRLLWTLVKELHTAKQLGLMSSMKMDPFKTYVFRDYPVHLEYRPECKHDNS